MKRVTPVLVAAMNLAGILLPGEIHAQRARPVAEITIGAQDDSLANLTHFRGSLVPMSDSTLLVPQPLEKVVKAFDASGKLIRVMGREGRGPFEISGLGPIGGIGDSGFWVSTGDGRIAVFKSNGQPSHELNTRALPYLPIVLAVLPGDTIIAIRSGESGLLLVAIDARAPREVRTIGSVPRVRHNHASGFALDLNETSFRSAQPLTDVSLLMAASDGSRILIVDRPVADEIDAPYLTIHVFDARGLRHVRRLMYRPRAMNESYVNRAVNELVLLLRRFPQHASTPAARLESAVREAMWIPKVQPPALDARIGSDGHVWLSREADGDSVKWDVLSSDLQTVTASFWLSNRYAIVGVRGTRFWALAFDSLDVPYVTRFRLESANKP